MTNTEILLLIIVFLVFILLLVVLNAGAAATNAVTAVKYQSNEVLKQGAMLWKNIQGQVAQSNPNVAAAVNSALKAFAPGM
jgi:hypothetical protein